MKSDPGESGLLKGLAQNDRLAIETIYSRHFAMIQSLIINNNGATDDARDIFQEAMIVLYEKSKTPDFVLHCQLKTYIYSVCRRLWLRRLAQSKRFIPEIQEMENTVPVEEDIEGQELRNQEFLVMEKALAGLGEPCKSLLEAFYLQKKNMSEIAGSFGYTNPENAKNQKYKCLMRLRKLFFSEPTINPV
ncbi:MAG: sigma-70 family RNA polymerase sigma factor [Chitinophagaceae bacterium]|nr:sigma-70 family RNA polymerase sigma factor [Chitinophagaceae bacterium]